MLIVVEVRVGEESRCESWADIKQHHATSKAATQMKAHGLAKAIAHGRVAGHAVPAHRSAGCSRRVPARAPTLRPARTGNACGRSPYDRGVAVRAPAPPQYPPLAQGCACVRRAHRGPARQRAARRPAAPSALPPRRTAHQTRAQRRRRGVPSPLRWSCWGAPGRPSWRVGVEPVAAAGPLPQCRPEPGRTRQRRRT